MFKSFIDKYKDPVIVVDNTFTIRYSNPSFRDQLHYTVDELQNKALAQVTKSDVSLLLEEPGAALILVNKHGEALSFTAEITEGEDEHGSLLFIICRRILQEDDMTIVANLQFTDLMTSVLDHTEVGIVITDPSVDDNPIIYANRGFETLTGYAAEDIIGQNCRFLQGEHTDEADVQKLRRSLAANQPVYVEMINYTKSGQAFWNELLINPVYVDSAGKEYFVGVQKDITRRKEAEQRLEESLEEIRDLSTPVVPLSEGLAVLPLVGVIHEERWQMMTAQVLEQVNTEGEEQLIIDVSGLHTFEEDFGTKLASLQSMLTLMGTELIITGIRPNMAQQSVLRGVNTSTFRTFSTVRTALKELL
ncbi:PAS domain S-box protein [Geomicrobium sp. JCM 19039]|uniref:PAS domain S-box protein n=1 Tax=Geomicrobium sp. JCM 19039 TaxID=1460636 RepID=UPI00045F0FDA|nr:PAS domain S-box protein [Geomicrobium sp. JCM 19039]GAK10683.1 transcription regulator Bat [Geomicrobium sp. JCM 19039]